jgi:hypothetical protein
MYHQDGSLAPEKRRIRNSPGRLSFAYFSFGGAKKSKACGKHSMPVVKTLLRRKYKSI